MTRLNTLISVAWLLFTGCSSDKARHVAPGPSGATAPRITASSSVPPQADAPSGADDCPGLNGAKDPCGLVAGLADHLVLGRPTCAFDDHGSKLQALLFSFDEFTVGLCADTPSAGTCRLRPEAGPSVQCTVETRPGSPPMNAAKLHALLKRCAGQDDTGPFTEVAMAPTATIDESVAAVWGTPQGWSAARTLPGGGALVSEWCTSPTATGNFNDTQQPVVDTIHTFEMFVAKVPSGDARAAPWAK